MKPRFAIKVTFESENTCLERTFASVSIFEDSLRDEDGNICADLSEGRWTLTAMMDEHEGETYTDITITPIII